MGKKELLHSIYSFTFEINDMVNCISKAKLLLIIHSTEELPNFDWKQPCILKMNLWVEISLNW